MYLGINGSLVICDDYIRIALKTLVIGGLGMAHLGLYNVKLSSNQNFLFFFFFGAAFFFCKTFSGLHPHPFSIFLSFLKNDA